MALIHILLIPKDTEYIFLWFLVSSMISCVKLLTKSVSYFACLFVHYFLFVGILLFILHTNPLPQKWSVNIIPNLWPLYYLMIFDEEKFKKTLIIYPLFWASYVPSNKFLTAWHLWIYSYILIKIIKYFNITQESII